MADGTLENPYTRDDVLRLIEENGGTAKGLDLSGKEFEEGIDLRGLDLRGVILKDTVFHRISKEALSKKGIELGEDVDWPKDNEIGALLSRAHLEGADLMGAHLEGG